MKKKKTYSRKNIRRILNSSDLSALTKMAIQEEQVRKQRIKEKEENSTEVCGKMVLNLDPLVSVDENLMDLLEPHQKDGVKFMWNACFESCEKIIETTGSGCILAHCMGLGKQISTAN